MDFDLKLGDHVRHVNRDDVGVGIITDIYLDGNCDVKFKNCDFSGIPLKFLASAEVEENNRKLKEEREYLEYERQRIIRDNLKARRNKFVDELHRVFHSDFLGADSYFEALRTDIITIEEFEDEKCLFVKNWLDTYTQERGGSKQLFDDEQIAAIAAVHGNIQVVARAGSGKTMVLVYRTLFLIKHCRINPAEILVLAFNRKAVIEVRKRLLILLDHRADREISAQVEHSKCSAMNIKNQNHEDIEAIAIDTVAGILNIDLPNVLTFHALAYAIVQPKESIIYDDPDAEHQELSLMFKKIICDNLRNQEFQEKVRSLMLSHYREDWKSLSGRRNHLLGNGDKYLSGVSYISNDDDLFANYLFEHNIDYKVSVRYHTTHFGYGLKSTRKILDFTIQANADPSKITEVKITPAFTELFRLSSKVRHDRLELDSFYTNLKNMLESKGIACIRLTEDEIWHRVKSKAIDKFTKALSLFIGRCRKQSLTPDGLLKLIENYKPLSLVEMKFLDLAHSFYMAYLNRLSVEGAEDFDGLMQRATELVSEGTISFQRKPGGGDLTLLRYICIDEFQDFSDLFYRLLVACRDANPKIELFCVGDDWQAINGFAGSNLRFFKHFETYFGKSRKLYISTNYRSSQSIVEIGNALMRDRGRRALANKQTLGEVELINLQLFRRTFIEKERHQGDKITPAVLRIAHTALAAGLDVVLLCRRNSLPWFVSYPDHENTNTNGRNLADYLELIKSFLPIGLRERITISTTHKYKGLEKQMVIVLDLVEKSYPLIHREWVFSRILGDSIQKITEENRRLLYVALTRAIDKLVIITSFEYRYPSPFLEEIKESVPLVKLDWSMYPPRLGIKPRIVITVEYSHVIKALDSYLKESGYQKAGRKTCKWIKSIPIEGSHLDNLKSEIWLDHLNEHARVEVVVSNETQTQYVRFRIEDGNWESTHLPLFDVRL